MTRSFRPRTAAVLPLVLSTVALLENLATYEIRRHVRDPYLRTAIILLLNGIGFSFAATVISPFIRDLFVTAHRGSHREGGSIGLWIFYVLAYGVVYYAFFVDETRGLAALLPRSLR